MSPRNKENLILSLDLGTNSIGWALLREDDKGKGIGIEKAGVRIFEAGVEGMEKDGKGEPRNKTRRDARSVRRRLERRARRKSVLFHALQKAGLLPPTPKQLSADVDAHKPNRAQERHSVMQLLDKKLRLAYLTNSGDVDVSLLPYMLRAKALDEKLEPHELGYVFYHLSQRRGFKSNRKADKSDKEDGVVKQGISDLQQRIEQCGARTLGEYFTKCDPHLKRIRVQWTARVMFENEFDKIWAAQKKYHPKRLNGSLYEVVRDAIYMQRPLKSQKHLIGKCSLEKNRRRAPWCSLEAQRFRIWQKLNDLEVQLPGEMQRPLTPEEAYSVSELLEIKDKATFKQISKHLGYKEAFYNLEKGGEKNLTGNKTTTRMQKVFGDKWSAFSEAEQTLIIDDLQSTHKHETAVKRGREAYGLDEERAEAFANLKLEDGYCNFSRKALRRILPELKSGKHLQTIIKDLYNVHEGTAEPLDQLPPVIDAIRDLRNPVVTRVLTDLRKVVNAIVREYGKPAKIRIELAREVRNSPKARQAIIKRNRDNEKEREKAAELIRSEIGIQDPRRNDILRVILADECNWVCPYTGKAISMKALFGGQFDIEHIIPFERSLDNSFMNKTLCDAEENRNIKRNKTPFEAYHGNFEKWSAIIARITGKGGLPAPKYKRFTMDTDEVEVYLEGFTNQQLVDTAYAARLSAQYLAGLYGGDTVNGIDPERKRRIFVSTGRLTSMIRGVLKLNFILGGGEKSRADHRHHAVDAIAIALVRPGLVQRISRAAQKANDHGVRGFDGLDMPWPTFEQDAREAIEAINVSHRVDHRVAGGLHEESFYSPSRGKSGSLCEEGKYIHIRKPLDSLLRKDVDNIVDPIVRGLVLKQIGSGDPKKVFADPDNLPVFPNGKEKGRAIKKVRIRKTQSTLPMGKASGTRYVAAGSNHHIEILETKDKRGKIKWEGAVVSRFEAMQRVKRGDPVVQRDHGPEKKFVFSLCGGDAIEVQNGDITRKVIVRGVSKMATGLVQLSYVDATDARLKKDIVSADGFFRKSPEPLRKLKSKKVAINPLGLVKDSND